MATKIGEEHHTQAKNKTLFHSRIVVGTPKSEFKTCCVLLSIIYLIFKQAHVINLTACIIEMKSLARWLFSKFALTFVIAFKDVQHLYSWLMWQVGLPSRMD